MHNETEAGSHGQVGNGRDDRFSDWDEGQAKRQAILYETAEKTSDEKDGAGLTQGAGRRFAFTAAAPPEPCFLFHYIIDHENNAVQAGRATCYTSVQCVKKDVDE